MSSPSQLVVDTILLSTKQSPDPGNAPAGQAILFTKDDGAGKCILAIRYANGATVNISTQNNSGSRLTQNFRNLVLGTSTNSTDLATKVTLRNADEIVMHDGESILGWSNLSADLTASGAGGLDTGSRVASTWYEIHAIRKTADGTQNLLLHRAKDYFLDQSQTTTNSAHDGLRAAAGNTKLAQGFQLATAGKVEFVDVNINKVGLPTGNMWFTIETDNAGSPSGVVLATSDKYDVSRLIVAANVYYIRFPFRAPVSLSTSTQYHLVFQGDFTISGSNYVVWEGNTANSYANGSAKAFNGSTWSAVGSAADFAFKLYVTRNDTAVTMPSGYDQRCLIGHTYNDGSNILKPFYQNNREVSTYNSGASGVWKDGNGWNVATLVMNDVSAFFPPIPVMGKLSLSAAATTTQIAVGPLRSTDIAFPSNEAMYLDARNNSTTTPQYQLRGFLVEYQGFMRNAQTDTATVWYAGWTW